MITNNIIENPVDLVSYDEFQELKNDVDSVYVNIQSFGAVCDNESIDNSNFIQQAIDYATTHKVCVIIPKGTFTCKSTITIQKGVKINCLGNIKYIGEGVLFHIMTYYTDPTIISGLKVSSVNRKGIAVKIARLNNGWGGGVRLDDFNISYFDIGVQAHTCFNSNVKNGTIEGCNICMWFKVTDNTYPSGMNFNNVNIIESVVVHTGNVGVLLTCSTCIKFLGCTFENFNTAVSYYKEVDYSGYVLNSICFDTCWFEANKQRVFCNMKTLDGVSVDAATKIGRTAITLINCTNPANTGPTFDKTNNSVGYDISPGGHLINNIDSNIDGMRGLFNEPRHNFINYWVFDEPKAINSSYFLVSNKGSNANINFNSIRYVDYKGATDHTTYSSTINIPVTTILNDDRWVNRGIGGMLLVTVDVICYDGNRARQTFMVEHTVWTATSLSIEPLTNIRKPSWLNGTITTNIIRDTITYNQSVDITTSFAGLIKTSITLTYLPQGPTVKWNTTEEYK